jgi:hypothetical protein
MGSGAMIYISSFIKIGSGIQKLMGESAIPRHTKRRRDKQHGDRSSLLSFFFFKIRKLGYKHSHITFILLPVSTRRATDFNTDMPFSSPQIHEHMSKLPYFIDDIHCLKV